MKTFKTGLHAAIFLVAGLFLSSCDKPKEIDDIKGEVATNKQQIVELKAELDTITLRLAALENTQIKSVSNTETQTMPTEQVAMLKKTISQCVQIVRGSAPKGKFEDEIFDKFDAFYSPASGRVQNNNQYVDQSAVYAFNKCMASKGWPLK